MITRKRFLVIVRAGDHSLHPRWTTSPATRSWDLVVSYYGRDPMRYRDVSAPRIDDEGAKWPGLHRLLCRERFWRDYDYIWLPDDDLAIDEDSVDALFATVAAHDLALAQPALSWSSFYSHPVTIRHPSFRLRYTDFVEIMAPCFSRGALEICVDTMSDSASGWGFDWTWPRQVGAALRRCAVIDTVLMTHTRPVGGPNYSALRGAGVAPGVEAQSLRRRHGIAPDERPRVLAAIDHSGALLDAERPADAEILVHCLRNDWAEFLASRNQLDLPTIALPDAAPRWSMRW
jgi:hypothetical protein